jgi:hypothetical protein
MEANPSTLQQAAANHKQAQSFIRDGRHQEALPLLRRTLEIRQSCKHTHQVCDIDIIKVLTDIGDVFLSLADYRQACDHFHMAWRMCAEFLGEDHDLTIESRTKWIDAENKIEESIMSYAAAPAA